MGRTRSPLSRLAFWKRTRPETDQPPLPPSSASSPQQDGSPARSSAGAIRCSSCQTTVPDGAKFCSSCGSPLTTTCPECGMDLAAGANFCVNCGRQLAEEETDSGRAQLHRYIPKELLAKLEATQTSGGMQGERRVVTMLFCDVAGSSTAAENLDPEEWAEIMNGAFSHLISPVYRYEGTLARLMGDAILAFFGAPIAHEDDPQRSVLAGVEIIEGIRPYQAEIKSKWGLDFEVRVGINTGLVVVGEVGSDLRLEYTALGDAINLAARMEQSAQPGTVQVSSDTHKLIEPLFDFESLGGIQVKGRSQPVQAYRVLGPKAEPGRLRGIKGLDAPLIGRDQEMDVLLSGIADLRQGRGQIVSVMGEAGLGKSRLIAELHHALATDGQKAVASVEPAEGAGGDTPATLGWYEGRSLSYETSTPYAPFVNLFGKYFRLDVEETDVEKCKRIRTNIKKIAPSRFEEITPFVCTLMGFKLSGEDAERVRYLRPPQVRERVFNATCEYLAALTTAGPLVLVFEDLHWIDPASLDLLERLMALTDRVALMIVGVFRPLRGEPSWRFHEIATRDYTHRYTAVEIQPLDEDNSRELVASLLHVEDLPEKVRALVLAKAEGNPFYVEEVIRSLIDRELVVRENSHWRATQDIENISVPDTLTGVITARLDRLDEGSRRVAQTASVIGREFQSDTLADVHQTRRNLNEALAELQQRELIRERDRLPQLVYLFKHALTQETAYASLLLSSRRELHRRVAECLERTDADRVEDISRHFLEAREESRALPYLVAAGDRAARAYSTGEAIGCYTRALEILETVRDPSLSRQVHEGLGGALTFGNDVPGAVENYHKMYHTAQDYGDLPMQVSALNKLGFVTALMQGQFPEAEQHLVDSERLALECNDLPGLAELHMTYCYLRVPFGNFDDAMSHLNESARIGGDLGLEEPRLFGLTHIANTLIYMARFDEAWQTAQEARKLAEESGNRKWLSHLLALTSPLYHLRNGDLDAASQSAAEGADLAVQIGAAEEETYGFFIQGQISWVRGEYERAIACQQRSLHASRMAGLPYLEAMALCALGTANLEIGSEYLGQAVEYHDKALETMANPLGEVMGAMIWAELGFCALAMGELDRAGELFQKGLTVSTASKFLARPQLLAGSALVALARNTPAEAAKLASKARDFAEERGMKHFYPLVELAEAQVNAAQGDTEKAVENFQRAEELALEMQMRGMVLQARGGAAKVLSTSGRTAEADTKVQGARAMIDEIAGLFQDSNLRDSFVNSANSRLA